MKFIRIALLAASRWLGARRVGAPRGRQQRRGGGGSAVGLTVPASACPYRLIRPSSSGLSEAASPVLR